MGSKHVITAVDVKDLRTLADLLTRSPAQTRDWASIDRMIKFCCKYIWMMPFLATDNWRKYIRTPADTVVRYYNDAVQFITTGKRDISIEAWDAVVRSAIRRDFYGSDQTVKANIGTVVLQAFSGQTTDVTKTLSHSGRIIAPDLATMQEKDIILMWSMRVNGLEDMVFTLAAMAEVVAAIQSEH